MKMYKKFKIELIGTSISYLESETKVTANFRMTDPSQNVGSEESPVYRNFGQYSVEVSFPAGATPSKSDIESAVSDLDGVVGTY